jgi:hypothetical protein
MRCRAFPEKVLAEWCTSRKSREWRGQTAEWGRWISKNTKKWSRRAHGGPILVESEIDEIGGWKGQRSRTKMMWNRWKSRVGSARPWEVAEDGVRDRGVSKNVKGNGSGLRLLDIMRGTPAEGAGMSTDVEYEIDATWRIWQIRRSKNMEKGRGVARGLRNVEEWWVSEETEANTSIPDYHSEIPYWEYLEKGGCGGWERLMSCRAEWRNTAINHEFKVEPSERSEQGYKWYLDHLIDFWEMSIRELRPGEKE